MKRSSIVALLFVITIAPRALAWGRSASAPQWVKEAAAAPLPSYPADTAGVVLLDETNVSVFGSGEIRTNHRVICKILGTEGRDLGYAAVHYDSLRKLQSFNAWSINAKGEEFQVAERDAVETSAADGELYADQKMKIIKIPAAEPGTVFAYETIISEPAPQAMQDSWEFQREIPVRSARYHLMLPNGWTHEERWFNAKAIEPATVESAATWSVSDVAAIKEEPGRPPFAAIARRMAINFLAPNDARTMRNWNDFGHWYASLAASRTSATPALQTKARELTANAKTTLEKIEAVARFAQKDIRYVAIEIGIGGYQPHAAGDIVANRYGDCKDKVTAMISMLREIGVEAYYVIVSTNRGVIDRNFASLSGFNHAIVAIRIPQNVNVDLLSAVVTHPTLGKLLIFDPTNNMIALGYLPSYLQANDGLLVTADGGELIKLPLQRPERNQLVRTAKLTLDNTLKLSGTVTEVRTGELAASARAVFSQLNEADRLKYMEKSVAAHVGDFKLGNLSIENVDDLSKDLVVRYELTTPTYAKRAGNLVLLRPRVLGQKAERMLDLKERAHPYETEGPSLQIDDVEIATPEALAIEELPAATNVASPIVKYTSEAKVVDGVLHYKREYRMQTLDVPLADLPELNKAFGAILADERSSAVFRIR